MTYPIVELIRQNILGALQSVSGLSVESVARYGNSAGDGTAVLEMGEEKPVGESDESGAIGRHTLEQTFTVCVHVHNPSPGAADFDTLCNVRVADVRKAVMADVTRGGNALWTHLLPVSMFINDAGEIAGPAISFVVRYRTKLDDPYTLG